MRWLTLTLTTLWLAACWWLGTLTHAYIQKGN